MNGTRISSSSPDLGIRSEYVAVLCQINSNLGNQVRLKCQARRQETHRVCQEKEKDVNTVSDYAHLNNTDFRDIPLSSLKFARHQEPPLVKKKPFTHDPFTPYDEIFQKTKYYMYYVE